jgi:hypothetical protein
MKNKSPPDRPIFEVRYYELAESKPKPRLPNACGNLGRRIGRKCGELGVSIGNRTRLFVYPSLSLDLGDIRPRPLEFSEHTTWRRVVECGVGADFNFLSVAKRRKRLADITFESLRVIAPQFEYEICEAKRLHESQGSALRVALKSKATKQYSVVVSQSVPENAEDVELFLKVRDLMSNVEREVKLGPVNVIEDPLRLVNRVAVVGDFVVIRPRPNLTWADDPWNCPPYKVSLSKLFSNAKNLGLENPSKSPPIVFPET